MATADITLEINQEEPVTLTVTEAKLKPEQSKTVTPTYAEQTVLPDAGMTLGSVTVEPIPEPTDRLSITENGSYDVARIGTADVDVLPTLQTRTVEPKEYGQTIRADSSYDGLEQVNVLRIPEWYIVPQGSLELTANGSYDVTEKKTVNVAVPVPVMPEEYAIGGSISDGTVTKLYLRRGIREVQADRFKQLALLEFVDIPDSVTEIKNNAFFGCASLTNLHLPLALTTLGVSAFSNCSSLTIPDGLPDGLTTISNGCFQRCFALELSSLPNGITHVGSYAFYGDVKLILGALPRLETIADNAFGGCSSLRIDELPPTLVSIGGNAFYGCKGITHITFRGTPSMIASNAFNQCTNLLAIYVPWSEGEVANAPWGSTNATIHYNWEV